MFVESLSNGTLHSGILRIERRSLAATARGMSSTI